MKVGRIKLNMYENIMDTKALIDDLDLRGARYNDIKEMTRIQIIMNLWKYNE